jgi:hypothetical protein
MSHCHAVTLSHCHTNSTQNPKNAKITYVTSDKCYTVALSQCHTKKTKNITITNVTSGKCHTVTKSHYPTNPKAKDISRKNRHIL